MMVQTHCICSRSHLHLGFPVDQRCPRQVWQSWSLPACQKPLFWHCLGCHTPLWSQIRTPWPFASQIHSPPKTELCGHCPFQPDIRRKQENKRLEGHKKMYFLMWENIVFSKIVCSLTRLLAIFVTLLSRVLAEILFKGIIVYLRCSSPLSKSFLPVTFTS